jgi:hypothetical protein
VEQIPSLKETCRLKAKASFPVLVDLVQAYFNEQQPDLAWIQEFLLHTVANSSELFNRLVQACN